MLTTFDPVLGVVREPTYGALPDEESSVDVPSPRDRDVGSPLVRFFNIPLPSFLAWAFYVSNIEALHWSISASLTMCVNCQV